MKMRYILLVLTVILSTSCVVKPYKSPKITESELLFRNGNSDTTNIAATLWADYYQDIYLQRYIGEALDSNFNVRIALKQIEEARAYFKQSKAAFFPTLSANASAGYTNPSNVGSSAVPSNINMPIQNYSFSLGASWEVDIWGKLRSSKRASYANLLAQEQTKDAIATQLVADIASSYYQLLSLDFKLMIIKQTIINYKEYLVTVRDLKAAASVNEVAVQQALAQLYGAEALLPDLRAAIEVAENYLSLLLGRPGSKIDRSQLIDLDVVNLYSDMGVPAQLLQYRPDVRAAESRLRSSFEQFNMAKASMYPSLKLTGSVGSEAADIVNWFSMPTSLFWNAAAGLAEPIFAGRKLRTQKEVAKLQNEEALLAFRQQVLVAGMEVSNALLRSETSAEKLSLQKVQIEALRNAYDYSKELLVQGYSTYLDVLVAQSGLFNSELSVCDTYLEAMNQKIELYRALGGGWR